MCMRVCIYVYLCKCIHVGVALCVLYYMCQIIDKSSPFNVPDDDNDFWVDFQYL